MIVESLLIIGGAAATALVGIPIAVRLARPPGFGRYAPLDAAANRTPHHTTAGFVPLDLGPDPMRWPSENQREETGVPERLWPSQTWDDEHFGAFWRRGGAPPPSSPAERDYQERQAERRLASQQRLQAERRPQPSPRPSPSPSPRATPQPPPAEEPRRVRQATPRPEVRENQPPPAAPSAREIERMVASLGLAGTVQEIMQRTGWDFRQSAHYLARVRQQSGR